MVAPRRFCIHGHDTWETGRYRPGGQCRVCALQRSREARLRDPVRQNELKRRWRKLNPDKQKAAEAKWRRDNRLYDSLRGARRRSIQGNTRISQVLAQTIADYYGPWCVYCGAPFSGFDHLQPLSRGGLHVAENLAPCCQSCNSVKGDRPIWVMLGQEEVMKRVTT
ncbi:hypothetical protein LCGC14_0295120 [marine sediment metagenome]|uniref:HNH nuclease domain-containing protein n=1 Tax=marine sediment metagenome TaxID=412755 RepID=A0A0F9TX46_9ZZZZ